MLGQSSPSESSNLPDFYERVECGLGTRGCNVQPGAWMRSGAYAGIQQQTDSRIVMAILKREGYSGSSMIATACAGRGIEAISQKPH